MFSSRKLPRVYPVFVVLVLSSAAAVLHSVWEMTEHFAASVSTVKMGITNPKSEQGCELIEYLKLSYKKC